MRTALAMDSTPMPIRCHGSMGASSSARHARTWSCSNLAMPFVTIDQWPVETLHPPYSPEFEAEAARGEIWSFDPQAETWERVYASPMVRGIDGTEMRRHLGFRSMAVFQGTRSSTGALRRLLVPFQRFWP